MQEQPATHTECAKDAQGNLVVDGRAYPMAAELVATEQEIQAAVRAMAERIAAEYKGLRHRDTAHSRSTNITTNEKDSVSEAEISYDNPLIVISVLKGAYIFTADFVRYLGDCGLPHVADFIRVSSYNAGTTSTNTVNVLAWPKYTNLRGKHVLILEDVCDSGQTLKYLVHLLQTKYQPKSLKTCVFLNKVSAARKVRFVPEYSCLTGPNKYVIGYGFEVNDRYRDLRHVFVVKDAEAKRFPAKL